MNVLTSNGRGPVVFVYMLNARTMHIILIKLYALSSCTLISLSNDVSNKALSFLVLKIILFFAAS